MKSIIVFFVAALFLPISTCSFAENSVNEQGSGSALLKKPSAPLILADTDFPPDDTSINPGNEDDQEEPVGSSSESGGSNSETGGSGSESGGRSSETGGAGSETGGNAVDEDGNGTDTGSGSYSPIKPAW